MRDLLLIDTHALFHRSRNALARSMGEMTTSAGLPVTGTYGVLNTVFAILEAGDYDSVIPVYDKGGPNFRKKLSDAYKSNREKQSASHYADVDLLVEEVFPALGFSPVGVPGYEADDCIATISRKSPAYREVHILTVDTDLLALVTNRVRVILFNSAKKTRVYGVDEVFEKFEVYPHELKYFKALAGDSSDNVAGIKGIGKKTAIKVITEVRENPSEDFTVADQIAMHPKVRANAGTFLGNLRLVDLSQDVHDLRWFSSSPPSEQVLTSVLQDLEFKSMLKPARLGKIKHALRVL